MLTLAFLAGSAAFAENDPATRIATIEARIGGRIGVAAFDTSNNKHLAYRADERFPMCSTFKFLAAAAVLKRVDEGKEKLERFVSYGAEDILEISACDESPSQAGRDDLERIVRGSNRTER